MLFMRYFLSCLGMIIGIVLIGQILSFLIEGKNTSTGEEW